MTQTPPDAQHATVQAIRDHHARLARTMKDHAATIARSVDQLASPTGRRDRLVAFCTDEVLPHAAAEEATLYRAAADLPPAALLVQAMREEHVLLRSLVDALASARTSAETAGAAAALDAVFQSHLAKENDLLLPALLRAGADLGALLAGMHDVLGAPAEHHCTCGGQDGSGTPGAHADVTDGELDVRVLDHAGRHARIFAAFEALQPGTAFVLVNDHDPKPLSYQFAARYPGEFTWEYVESGPQVWRVRIGRP